MKKLYLLLLISLVSQFVLAQSTELFHRVKVDIKGREMAELARLGIETDHGIYEPFRSFTTDLSETELKLVKEAGFHTKIEIHDVVKHYREQLAVGKVAEPRGGWRLWPGTVGSSSGQSV